jgi:hypothetical protein
MAGHLVDAFKSSCAETSALGKQGSTAICALHVPYLERFMISP